MLRVDLAIGTHETRTSSRRRWAIRARLLGMSTREIALSLDRNQHTIKLRWRDERQLSSEPSRRQSAIY
jgi:hypothetical protein